MPKLVLDNLTTLSNQPSAIAKINSNNDKIEAALENTLSRNGASPNQMNADIDMNGNDLLNVQSVQAEKFIIEGVDLDDRLQEVIDAKDDAEDAAQASANSAADSAASAAQASVSEQNAAQSASNAASVSEVNIRNNVATAASLPVKDGITKLIILGEDGGEARSTSPYVGAPVWFTSPAGAGSTARNWYRASDVALERLNTNVRRAVESPDFRNAYRWRLALDVPFRSPDYNAVVAAFGSTYPQSFKFDPIAGQLAKITANQAVELWNFDMEAGTVEYDRTVKLGGTDVVSEGMVFTREGSTRYLHTRAQQSHLGRYDLTNPTNLSTISPTWVQAWGVDRLFDLDNGTLYLSDRATLIGGNRSRNRFVKHRWDLSTSLTRLGTVDFGATEFGYIEGVPSSERITKAQGFVVRGGYAIAGMGGGWLPSSGPTPYGYLGPKVFTTDGKKVISALVKPEAVLAYLQSLGKPATRTEVEGIDYLDGKYYLGVVYAATGTDPTLAAQGGFAIFELFSGAPEAHDFSNDAAPDLSNNVASVQAGQMMRTFDFNTATSLYIDSATGDVLDTWEKICDYLISNEQTYFEYYSSNATVIPITPDSIPTGRYVRITNCNNSTFRVDVFGVTSGTFGKSYAIAGTPGARTQTELPSFESGAIASGDYTATGVTNVNGAITKREMHWSRIGRIVTVHGSVSITPTAAGAVAFGISLPIPTTLADTYALKGLCNGVGLPGIVIGDVANNRASCNFTAAGTSSVNIVYEFSYKLPA